MIKKYAKLLIIFITAMFVTNIVLDITAPNLAFAEEEITYEDVAEDENVGSAHKCAPSKYKEDFKNCLFCNLFTVFYSAVSTVAAEAFKTFANPVAMVVEIGFALWIAFKIITFVSSMSSVSSANLLKEILTQAFLVVVVLFFLRTDLTLFMQYFFEPIFNTGFKLAEMIMGNSAGAKLKSCNVQEWVAKLPGAEGEYASGGLPVSMGESILCLIAVLQSKVEQIMNFGQSLICIGFRIKKVMLFLPNIIYVLSGAGLYAAGFILMLMFPFLLLDSVMDLAISVALLPAALGAWLFKNTRKYTSIVFNTFLTTSLTFLFFSLIISIVAAAIDNVLGGIDTSGLDNNVDKILDLLGFRGFVFTKILFVLFMGYAMLDLASDFASNFGGGGFNLGTARQTGAVLSKPFIGAGKAVTTAIGSKVKGYVSGLAQKRANRKEINSQKRQLKRAERRFNRSSKQVVNPDGSVSVAGRFGKTYTRNEDGTFTVSQKRLFSGNLKSSKTYNVERNSSGKITNFEANISEFKRNGSTVTTNIDNTTTSVSATDKNGQVLYSNTVYNRTKGDNLVDDYGNVNQRAHDRLYMQAYEAEQKMISLESSLKAQEELLEAQMKHERQLGKNKADLLKTQMEYESQLRKNNSELLKAQMEYKRQLEKADTALMRELSASFFNDPNLSAMIGDPKISYSKDEKGNRVVTFTSTDKEGNTKTVTMSGSGIQRKLEITQLNAKGEGTRTVSDGKTFLQQSIELNEHPETRKKPVNGRYNQEDGKALEKLSLYGQISMAERTLQTFEADARKMMSEEVQKDPFVERARKNLEELQQKQAQKQDDIAKRATAEADKRFGQQIKDAQKKVRVHEATARARYNATGDEIKNDPNVVEAQKKLDNLLQMHEQEKKLAQERIAKEEVRENENEIRSTMANVIRETTNQPFDTSGGNLTAGIDANGNQFYTIEYSTQKGLGTEEYKQATITVVNGVAQVDITYTKGNDVHIIANDGKTFLQQSIELNGHPETRKKPVDGRYNQEGGKALEKLSLSGQISMAERTLQTLEADARKRMLEEYAQKDPSVKTAIKNLEELHQERADIAKRATAEAYRRYGQQIKEAQEEVRVHKAAAARAHYNATDDEIKKDPNVVEAQKKLDNLLRRQKEYTDKELAQERIALEGGVRENENEIRSTMAHAIRETTNQHFDASGGNLSVGIDANGNQFYTIEYSTQKGMGTEEHKQATVTMVNGVAQVDITYTKGNDVHKIVNDGKTIHEEFNPGDKYRVKTVAAGFNPNLTAHLNHAEVGTLGYVNASLINSFNDSLLSEEDKALLVDFQSTQAGSSKNVWLDAFLEGLSKPDRPSDTENDADARWWQEFEEEQELERKRAEAEEEEQELERKRAEAETDNPEQ